LKALSTIKSHFSRNFGGESLRAKTTRGGAWLGGASAAEQVSRFARNMLLTRLLAPSSFGAMAIVLSFSSLIASLSDVGMWPAVVQNPRGGDREYLDAAWWMGILRAVGLYVVIFLVSPWVARFYGEPDLAALLRITMLSIVLDGLISPRSKLSHKEMQFGKYALINNGGGICGVILTIVLSFILRNVWALGIGYCGENAFRCLVSYILYPGWPSLKWDRHAVQDLLKFSKGMLGLSFLNLVFTRTDIFIIGKLYSPAILGLYTMGVNLVQTPSSFIINMLSSALLPAYSQIQEDRQRARRILSEVTSWTIVLGMPAVATIGLCSSSLLTIAYGKQYRAVAGVLAVAAVVALLNTLNSLITTVFFAAGEPALHRRAVAVSAVVMVVVAYPCCRWLGPVGGMVASLIAITASYALQIMRSRHIWGGIAPQYNPALWLAIVASVAVVGVGILAHSLGFTNHPAANIAIAVLACCVGYLCCLPAMTKLRFLE